MASKYTAYRIVHCSEADQVDQAGVGKLLAEGWELWGSPVVLSDVAVYQAMVKPAAAAPVVDTEPQQTGHPWAGA